MTPSNVNEEVRNAVIEGVSLRMERGFMLDSWITLDYGGSGQGFGGWALYLDRTATHHRVMSHAGHWIWRVMEIAGVERWDDLKGRCVRARIVDGRVLAIGHITKDEWFNPTQEFANTEVSNA